MIELLSSASLLLTIVTVLYSVWYSEIKEVILLKSETHQPDNIEKHKKAKKVRWKSLTLAVGTIILSLILLPNVINIISSSLHSYQKPNYSFWQNYSSVKTTFCLIWLVFVAFSIHFGINLIKVRSQIKNLNPNKDK